MPKSNRQRVEEALDLFVEGFTPFVAHALTQLYPNDWAKQAAERGGWAREKGAAAANPSDPDFLLWVTISHWQNPFRQVLGHQERSYIGELRDARHRWAHKEAFTAEATYRVLDTVYLLLSSVGAPQAAKVDDVRQEALRLRFEEMTKKAVAAPLPGVPSMSTASGMPGWREVIEPHDDVATGRYQQAEFAADLAQVYRGNGLPEYSEPEEFFRRTFLTRGLRTLLVQTMRRLAGQTAEPVIDLLTNFGGGKTHSLLAVYHLAGPNALALPGMDEISSEAGINDFPSSVTRAVIVGTALSPHLVVNKADGVSVRTIWGEMAYQLAGSEGYSLVANADQAGVNPGSQVLQELLEVCSPCVILIDEWVAYARQLWGRDDLLGGSFDAQMTFAQSLSEAVRAVPNAMLFVSIPASDRFIASSDVESGGSDAGIEVGGVGGLEALKRLRNVMHRMDSPWQPATAEEGFEIVRRRLFKPLDTGGFAKRDAVARRFVDMYRQQVAEFPADSREAVYEDRIKRAYPIHPEFFDRLYQDWAALERFQRTRGVLRLMAAVVHSLWVNGDQNPLILPASLPLDDQSVFEEVTRHLEDNWKPVVDVDIDGQGSVPNVLDRDVPALGRLQAARRVARTIFIGSAPTTQRRSQDGSGPQNPNRGIEDVRVKLGCAMPGENIAVFGDALRRLTDKATHLYVDGSRYWYSTVPSVASTAQALADGYGDDVVYEELARRIQGQTDLGEFARVHRCPHGPGDVTDEAAAGLVILRAEYAYASRSASSEALTMVNDLLTRRAGGERNYRNMLVFLAADQNRLPDLLAAIRQHKAWAHIYDNRAEMNLDQFGVTQALTKRDTADDTVRQRLNETYIWLLVPTQAPEDAGFRVDPVRVNGQGGMATRASQKAVPDYLSTVYGATNLRLELDRIPLWRGGDHVDVRQVWEDFARYLYLPRLKDQTVFLDAVAAGPSGFAVDQDGFGYAESYDAGNGRYRGLVMNGRVTSPVADGLSVLVMPNVALKQKEDEEQAHRDEQEGQSGSGKSGGGAAPGSGTGLRDGTAGASGATRHFFARRDVVNPARLAAEAGSIAAELVPHLAATRGVNVRITIEIEAEGPGFDEDTKRVVTENAKTLGLDPAEFS
jgi:predicted AAA+ superfamily ATPase